jgi:tetratricopeptide (TPR) repeat protein
LFFTSAGTKKGAQPLGWQKFKICTIGLLAVGLAHAGTDRAPRELLQRLQDVVQQGNLEAAAGQLGAAIKEFPSDPGLYNLLGVIEAQRGNRSAAEADFLKALAFAPRSIGTLLNLGRVYLDNVSQDPNAAGRALDTFQKILRYEPNNSEALYQSAALLSSAGSYQTSLNHLDRLPPAIQDRAQALAVRCADQAALGQPDRAARTAERLLTSPDLTEGDVVAILPQVDKQDESLAVRILQGLVNRQLAGPDGLSRLGSFYERQGKLPRAREVLERAEQAGPPSVEILSELARVAYQQHDREGALGYLAHARDLEPQNAGVHFFFGVICIELNLPLDARKSLDEAVRLDPENAYYNYALGSVALYGRDPDRALSYFEKYVKTKPEDPRGRFALGVVRFYLTDYEEATRDLRGVADKPKTAAGAHYFLGRIAKLQDNLPLAEIELKQAIAADPHFANALAELGLIDIRLRKYDAAGDELDRAFALEPDNFDVNADLLILYQKKGDPRAAQQQARFEEIKKKQAEDEHLLWRTIEVKPY